MARRRSFLDYGGENSVNNFASSLQRSTLFLHLDENEDISPGTSIHSGPPSLIIPHHEESPLLKPDYSLGEPPMVEEQPLLDHVRKSTSAQTVFNSINVLIGIGVLSVPLGFKFSGWLTGLICVTLCAISTCYTAILMSRCLAKVPHLMTYNDIGNYVIGGKVNAFIFVCFVIDLLAAAVSLVLVFSDSFHALMPEVPIVQFKVTILSILFFVNFLPLKVLSLFSLVGVACTTSIVLIAFVCGLVKPESPGSLHQVFPLQPLPSSWQNFFLGLGIFMAPWGGHAVFPELFRDMKTPSKYSRSVKITFFFAFVTDIFIGMVGLFMFGDGIKDEYTKNLLETSGYPKWIPRLVFLLMGLLPVAKLPLVSKPIVSFLDAHLGTFETQWLNSCKHIVSRAFLSFLLLLISITVTSFGRIMAFLGSAICFTVCITLPLIFYLCLFSDELSKKQIIMFRCGIATSIFLSSVGSVVVFLDS